MTKEECRAPDGAKVAYDVAGTGDAVLLLHGGFVHDRSIWAEGGWLVRLGKRFRLLSVDLRGHGGSSRPLSPDAYAIERFEDDIRAVLAAEQVTRLSIVGYSLGALIGLRVATSDHAVERLALLGGGFGPAVPEAMRAHMLTRIREVEVARANGEQPQLTPDEAAFVRRADLGIARAVYTAMADWRPVEPEELRCPTLFVTGTENPFSMDNLARYRARMSAVDIGCVLLEGASHADEIAPGSPAIGPIETFLEHSTSEVR